MEVDERRRRKKRREFEVVASRRKVRVERTSMESVVRRGERVRLERELWLELQRRAQDSKVQWVEPQKSRRMLGQVLEWMILHEG